MLPVVAGRIEVPQGYVILRDMKVYRRYVYRRGHELANQHGAIARSRFVLYEKLGGVAGKCNWCDVSLTWSTLCADHVDGNIINDTAENLVPSCRGCNANRDDGTGNGRRKLRPCEYCKKDFLPNKRVARFCSNDCASKMRPSRGTKSKHGTRTRYVWGCRCSLCRSANTEYWREWKERASESCWQ